MNPLLVCSLALFLSLHTIIVSSFMMIDHNKYDIFQVPIRHSQLDREGFRPSITVLSLMPPSLSHGETLFQQTCSSCHPGGANVISKERNLQKEALDKFIGLSQEENGIMNFVKDSNFHRGALAFTGRLSNQDFKDVASYVYKQAMEDKW